MSSSADLARQQYPQYAWLLDNPEVGPILERAANEGWDSARLQGAIYGTNFWKSLSESARQEAILYHTDPATWQANRANKSKDILAMAAGMGITIPAGDEYNLADSAIRYGWSEQFLRDELSNRFVYSATGQTGAAAQAQQQIRQLSAEYLIPISDATMGQWEKQILDGQITTDSLRSYFIEQAKSLFPSLASALDQGITVQQYTEPYKQIAAQTLEVAPASIDMMDPKWNRALNQVDPKTGQRVSMTLYDWQTLMRTDPQYKYDNTEGARTQAAELTTSLAKSFGAIA